MKGRKPKPTRLKLLTGNPGRRKLPPKEPQPKGQASCPSWLDKVAKAEWERVAPQLRTLGLLTDLDQAALACYCVAVSDLVEARRLLKHGHLVESDDRTAAHPAAALADKALKQIRAFCSEFGMSPSSRGRMNVGPAATEDEFETFLSA